MPPNELEAAYFSPDIVEFVVALNRHGVRYLIIGGEAVIFYGHARYTGDVDFFYDGSESNAPAMFAALSDFWDGRIPDLKDHSELQEPGIIIQFGRPPNRIDLLNRIDGVEFGEAWQSKVIVGLRLESGVTEVPYLGLDLLIRNKEASGRPKDMDDLRYLTGGARGQRPEA